MIRIWNAYSCNNSGASRLVARFVDAAREEPLDSLHDIESPQLVCKPCGGLYDLEAFT